MIVFLYKWKLKPAKVKEFSEAWSVLTEHYRHRGSLGSCLHYASDGCYYAYAQWPSKEQRSRAFLEDHSSLHEAQETMREAILEHYEAVELEPVHNLLLPSLAMPSPKFAVANGGFAPPQNTVMFGRSCYLEPAHKGHGQGLYEVFQEGSRKDWDYLPYGPFEDAHAFQIWFTSVISRADPMFYTVMSQESKSPLGLAAYSRIDQSNGVIEIAHVHFSSRMRRTRTSNEAVYLFLKNAFEDLGYRRVEWKCDASNERSVKAALRLGFTYEGRFRQDRIVKGLSRDTNWFSIIDKDWPRVRRQFETMF